MFDADYEAWLDSQDKADADYEAYQALKDKAVERTGEYEVKDSGKKSRYDDGMQRDTTEGKPRFSLMFPEGVPYEEQLLTRVAMHYMSGGQKYGDRNWEKSSTEESLNHHREALFRHFVKFLLGVEDGEDHAAAVVWNVNAVDLTRRNIRSKASPVADDKPARENYDPYGLIVKAKAEWVRDAWRDH